MSVATVCLCAQKVLYNYITNFYRRVNSYFSQSRHAQFQVALKCLSVLTGNKGRLLFAVRPLPSALRGLNIPPGHKPCLPCKITLNLVHFSICVQCQRNFAPQGQPTQNITLFRHILYPLFLIYNYFLTRAILQSFAETSSFSMELGLTPRCFYSS